MNSVEGEDYEPSGLEYARANGLSRNHLAEPFPLFDARFLMDNIGFSLLDDSSLQQFQLDYPVKADRLLLSRESAEAISRATKYEPVESFDDPFIPRTRQDERWKTLVELPLLRSVNEMDCKEFARRDGFEINLKDVEFPMEIVEGDDGLDLDAKLFTLGLDVVEVLKKEKLAVSREAIAFLSSALRDDWTAQDDNEARGSSTEIKKVSKKDLQIVPSI